MFKNKVSNKFYFEESTIERIICNVAKREIALEITFCVWAQDWYNKENDNELERLILTFKNVTESNCRDYNAGKTDLIKSCELITNKTGGEGVKFSSWYAEGLYSITIYAEDVTAEYKEGEAWNSPTK